MNFKLVSRLLSVVMVILALAFATCYGVVLLLDTGSERPITGRAFLFSIAVSLASAGALFITSRNASTRFFRREALSIIGLGWILSSIVGCVPYLFITPEIGIAGAIFESVSGLTTTGASVLTNLEELPRSLLFWRSLSQWIGGMGVVVFFVAILGFLGAGAKLLYSNEASGSTNEFEESRVQSTILKLIYIYAGLSVTCAVAYRIAGMSWFDSICHMFATVASGGFSTRSGSIMDFHSPAIEIVGIVFMILAAISFPLILSMLYGRWNRVKANTELIGFFVILGLSVFTIAGVIIIDGTDENLVHAIRSSTFQTVSIMTTTGFASEDFAQWSALPQSLLLVLMVIGGCSGSTAGGIKVNRVIVALRLCVLTVERSFRSRVVRQVRMNNRVLSEQATQDIVMYLILTGVIFLISVQLASLFETNFQMDTSLSAVHACFFNVGPGFAEVGPTETYAPFHTRTKLLLSLLMIMGRLELYAILALFAPSLWRRLD
jgi:trk system potassium uptake protein TrkH